MRSNALKIHVNTRRCVLMRLTAPRCAQPFNTLHRAQCASICQCARMRSNVLRCAQKRSNATQCAPMPFDVLYCASPPLLVAALQYAQRALLRFNTSTCAQKRPTALKCAFKTDQCVLLPLALQRADTRSAHKCAQCAPDALQSVSLCSVHPGVLNALHCASVPPNALHCAQMRGNAFKPYQVRSVCLVHFDALHWA